MTPPATRRLVVLRPQPGNARTVGRIEAMGLEAIALPLFAVSLIDWTPPDPAEHDAILFTSANAPRHAGKGIASLSMLPVLAVGAHTAAAAGGAALTGTSDAAALIEQAAQAGYSRILHLGGRETTVAPCPPVTRSIAVYASDELPIAPADLALSNTVALLHSARAARRFAELIEPARRAVIRLAAFSPAILSVAGEDWGESAAAPDPTDAALLDLARTLAD